MYGAKLSTRLLPLSKEMYGFYPTLKEMRVESVGFVLHTVHHAFCLSYEEYKRKCLYKRGNGYSQEFRRNNAHTALPALL